MSFKDQIWFSQIPICNPQPTTKMKTSDKQLYNALAYLVLFGKQLKNTLEELTFAIEKSESLLIAHNLKSTRSKKWKPK